MRYITTSRGWLCELFRHDDLPAEFHPVMAYISMTEAGVAAGRTNTSIRADLLLFHRPVALQGLPVGSSRRFADLLARQTEIVGVDRPMLLIVPPGVVHAYKNVGGEPGLVFNCPNRLYKGPGRKEAVDEIRHEDQTDSPYRLD